MDIFSRPVIRLHSKCTHLSKISPLQFLASPSTQLSKLEKKKKKTMTHPTPQSLKN